MDVDYEELLFLSTFISSNKPLELIKQLVVPSLSPILITDAGHIDGGYKIVYANKAFLKITQYELAEVVGQSPAIFQGPNSNKEVLKKLGAELKENGYFHGASINYKKDGTEYPVEWVISPIKDDSGKIEFFVSMQKDLSTMFALAQKVKLSNEKFRQFLVDVSLGKLDEGETQEQTKELLGTLKENAKIYSAPLREEEAVDLFDDAFFDFGPDDAGALIDKCGKPIVAAKEYMSEERLGAGEIESLQDVISNLEDEIELLSNDSSQLNRLQSVEQHFRELSDAIFFLIDFTDTAMALNQVADCLPNVTQEQLDGFVTGFLLSLTKEVEGWLKSVFIEQTSDNIFEGENMIIAAAQQIVAIAK